MKAVIILSVLLTAVVMMSAQPLQEQPDKRQTANNPEHLVSGNESDGNLSTPVTQDEERETEDSPEQLVSGNESVGNLSTPVPQEEHVRVKRASCQLLGNGGCNLHCRARGYRRGSCNSRRVCNCYRG